MINYPIQQLFLGGYYEWPQTGVYRIPEFIFRTRKGIFGASLHFQTLVWELTWRLGGNWNASLIKFIDELPIYPFVISFYSHHFPSISIKSHWKRVKLHVCWLPRPQHGQRWRQLHKVLRPAQLAAQLPLRAERRHVQRRRCGRRLFVQRRLVGVVVLGAGVSCRWGGDVWNHQSTLSMIDCAIYLSIYLSIFRLPACCYFKGIM